VLSAFKSLTVKQLVADDAVYRSLKDRFGIQWMVDYAGAVQFAGSQQG
jgi:hypothetical protein